MDKLISQEIIDFIVEKSREKFAILHHGLPEKMNFIIGVFEIFKINFNFNKKIEIKLKGFANTYQLDDFSVVFAQQIDKDVLISYFNMKFMFSYKDQIVAVAVGFDLEINNKSNQLINEKGGVTMIFKNKEDFLELRKIIFSLKEQLKFFGLSKAGSVYMSNPNFN